ncbi:MAG: methylmalonyl-CoA mutase [Chloroflexaceae bacterium]|nr:methylmalonyl-CoA mutase [Chloroflexaceae bacterium]
MTTPDTALFAEFTAPSYAEWRAEAERSLKGVDFERRLIRKTYEGLMIKPLYVQEDVATLPHLDSLPGVAPFLRAATATGYLVQVWQIAQELPYPTASAFNQAIRSDLERGQTAVVLLPDLATRLGLDPDQAEVGMVGAGGTSLATANDLAQALAGVDLSRTPVYIEAGLVAVPLAALLLSALRESGTPLHALRGSLASDPLGSLATAGSLPVALPQLYAELAALTGWAHDNAPQLATLNVDASIYHNSGGHAVQELAFAMATAVDYLREMQAHQLHIDTVAPRLHFSFAVGANFFMEIAKLRAARLLWSRIVAAFGGSTASQQIHLHARTALWNVTRTDPYVNMLRSTTEAFAAALGGCESLTVAPFDTVFGLPDEFSRRTARNMQLVLQNECYLPQVIDPAGGSWYLECLTDELARAAWGLFQDVEKQGGMLAALQAGLPQAQVAATAAERAKSLASRKDVLVGTNMYANAKEKPHASHLPDYAAVQQERAGQVAAQRTAAPTAPLASADLLASGAPQGATIGTLTQALRGNTEASSVSIPPLHLHRLAEPFEQLREAAYAHAEQHGQPPLVFLATMGPVAQHKPRAEFARGFFEVGGFAVQDGGILETPEAAVQAALASAAPIVVICSTDDTYPELVPPITQQLKAAQPEVQVVLAGYPQDQIAAHQAAGVDAFIHLRANVYETLTNLQQTIGVRA